MCSHQRPIVMPIMLLWGSSCGYNPSRFHSIMKTICGSLLLFVVFLSKISHADAATCTTELILASVFGGALALVLIILLSYCCIKRRRKASKIPGKPWIRNKMTNKTRYIFSCILFLLIFKCQNRLHSYSPWIFVNGNLHFNPHIPPWPRGRQFIKRLVLQ